MVGCETRSTDDNPTGMGPIAMENYHEEGNVKDPVSTRRKSRDSENSDNERPRHKRTHKDKHKHKHKSKHKKSKKERRSRRHDSRDTRSRRTHDDDRRRHHSPDNHSRVTKDRSKSTNIEKTAQEDTVSKKGDDSLLETVSTLENSDASQIMMTNIAPSATDPQESEHSATDHVLTIAKLNDVVTDNVQEDLSTPPVRFGADWCISPAYCPSSSEDVEIISQTMQPTNVCEDMRSANY